MIALFFDTETTGFKTEDFIPEIVQIAAILQDTETRRVLGELNVIVVAGNPIPEQVSAIHGITDEISKKYGVGQDNAQSLFGELVMIADALVAHNIEFDMQMVHDNWLPTFMLMEGKQQYDTMHELTPIMKLPKNGENHYHDDKYPDFKAPRLTEAYRYFFDADLANAHNAMADVRACRDLYFAIQDRQK